MLDFTRHNTDAGIHEALDFGRHAWKESQDAADVEASDDHRHTLPAKLQRDVGGPTILIRLDSNQAHDDLLTGFAVEFRNLPEGKFLHRLVERMDAEFHFGPTRAFSNVLGQAVQTGQGIAGKHAPPVTDDVAIVVVLGWLYEEDTKRAVSELTSILAAP